MYEMRCIDTPAAQMATLTNQEVMAAEIQPDQSPAGGLHSQSLSAQSRQKAQLNVCLRGLPPRWTRGVTVHDGDDNEPASKSQAQLVVQMELQV